MSNLKELTWEHHKEAERQGFVKVLMSGKINPKFYATYLYNQLKKYEALEDALERHDFWDEHKNLFYVKQTSKIRKDWEELWPDLTVGTPITMPSTWAYLDRIQEIKRDKHALIAHAYVLHLGDLSGGQIIAKRVPGEGRMYKFKGDVSSLKETVKSFTDDSMAEEAKYVFESATNLFKELMETDIEHYME